MLLSSLAQSNRTSSTSTNISSRKKCNTEVVKKSQFKLRISADYISDVKWGSLLKLSIVSLQWIFSLLKQECNQMFRYNSR